ncbi:MAG: FAD-dependent oxidoreductase, partial [Candidatus Nanopelagicaceae bacterium]
MRLRAPLPGWRAQADVVVIGSGVAGLTTALQIRAHNLSVLLVTKSSIDAGSTKWAQGGIAAALGPGDSPSQHEEDTLVAGAGLCDLAAVKVLVSEGPEAVRKLIARGAVFDKSETGEIALTREGGHLRNRILHAGGDATGAEVSRALLAAVSDDLGIEVIEHALVLDVLKSNSGRV